MVLSRVEDARKRASGADPGGAPRNDGYSLFHSDGNTSVVMRGLDPRIHLLKNRWIAGTQASEPPPFFMKRHSDPAGSAAAQSSSMT
ncbi:MAG: hypothetical protein KDJ76_04940 [Xanthobacteraceae bacterium]|nr:hypothetical protein [Xanthobacteraceae bacterium]